MGFLRNPNLSEFWFGEQGFGLDGVVAEWLDGERWVQGQNRIYLVLEYCAGGDLAAYIQRYGKVTEVVARHFMRQLGVLWFPRFANLWDDNDDDDSVCCVILRGEAKKILADLWWNGRLAVVVFRGWAAGSTE